MVDHPFSSRAVALTIACTDIGRSEAFYRNVLGARPDPHDGYGCLWFKLGDFRINLLHNAASRSPAVFPEHAMPILWIETDHLDVAEDAFARQGVTIVQSSDGQSMMIADPDGLVIELWQAAVEEADGAVTP
jgi:catechol 2,3-dioxygenase-like lactoylglutathione lyase family enzyme